MKIIYASWEKRNLGVNCEELNAGYNDSLNEFIVFIRELKAEYQVVKIPAGRTDMLLTAQSFGFQVIELNIQLSRIMNKYSLPSIYKRFEAVINVVEAEKKDIKFVLDEIKKGDLFVTDKVARDPYFSTRKSGNRYYEWSKDVLDQGAHLYLAQYKGMNVGFGLNRSDDGHFYDAFLGGVFPQYANKGLGFLTLHTNLMSIASQGGNKVKTGVSSNNSSILRLHLLFGFDIQEMKYILIKHA
ncbi:hypothetical protein [Acetobacterium bakii]|uniref:N-acetyltransferase domain-containing protein n=1 Tax=Acetobacterium bakii TaxID=52689 RepID=A0A0L6U2C5_9FIRM|nr:hypothetical protein [Acetobacterium bakii]KNZ42661.1 hypothetical protein AKG39_05855 [Acetobacterium bakii]